MFLIYWLVLIFTGKLNSGLYSMMAMYERYNARATGFLVGWSQTYAPFEFTTDPSDNNSYPAVRLNLPAVPESVPRSAALNVLKAIPHYILLMIYFIGAVVVAIISLFPGAVHRRLAARHARVLLVRVSNYQYRIWTYVTMVDNDYPKFGLLLGVTASTTVVRQSMQAEVRRAEAAIPRSRRVVARRIGACRSASSSPRTTPCCAMASPA